VIGWWLPQVLSGLAPARQRQVQRRRSQPCRRRGPIEAGIALGGVGKLRTLLDRVQHRLILALRHGTGRRARQRKKG